MTEFSSQFKKDWPRWAEIFTAIVKNTAQPDESVDDILAGALALGKRRARVLNRDFDIVQDMPFALSWICKYPFKPFLISKYRNYIEAIRKSLLAGASTDERVEERFSNVVTDDILRLELYQLYEMLHTGSGNPYTQLTTHAPTAYSETAMAINSIKYNTFWL